MELAVEVTIEGSRLIAYLRIGTIGILLVVLFHVNVSSQTCTDTQVLLSSIMSPPHELCCIANLAPTIDGRHVVLVQPTANSTETLLKLVSRNYGRRRVGV